MKTLVILFLLAILWTNVTPAKKAGLEVAILNQINNGINNGGITDNVLKSVLWPEFVKYIPQSAILPGLSIDFAVPQAGSKESDSGRNQQSTEQTKFPATLTYMCVKESKMLLNQNPPAEVKSNKKTLITIEAKFSTIKPVEYEMKCVLQSGTKYTTTDLFKVQNTLKFSVTFDLVLPDLSKKISNPKCLVKIKKVYGGKLTDNKLGEFSQSNAEELLDLGRRFWGLVTAGNPEDQVMSLYTSVALRKAFVEVFSGKSDFWICLEEDLKKEVGREEESEYQSTFTEEFKHICGKERITL